MPAWWSWYYYLNPVSWTLYGLIESQLGDVTSMLTTYNGQTLMVKEFVTQFLGFTWGFRIWSALILLGFIITFRAIAAGALTFLNYQRR